MAGTDARPRSTGMTSWSRHAPVNTSGNTDHWTKMKCRHDTYRTTQSADKIKVIPEHRIDQIESLNKPGDRFKVEGGNRVRALPPGSLSDSLLGQLGGKAPGDHDKLTRPSTNLQKSWMNNEFQGRARDNFRYWLINRPQPTSFGKYGIGSYKMVMGLGMAPRT